MKFEELASSVSQKIERLQNADTQDISRAEASFQQANSALKTEIAGLKAALINLEFLRGVIQYYVPPIEKPPTAAPAAAVAAAPVAEPSVKADVNTDTAAPAKVTEVRTPVSTSEKARPAATAGKSAKSAGGGKGNEVVDVSRLDMRVGRILEVSKHPDADTLYVEKVDLGEANPRTIISGLVKHVPIEKMQNLVGIFMCNLKPVKMRGIESQGMMMCSTSSDGLTCEPLEIHGVEPAIGDRVFVEGYPGEPDAQLNPKKKVFESVKPDLRTDNGCIATYKGSPWKLKGNPSAIIRAPTLADGQIS